MLLVATIPVDVVFSNYPVATSVAAGFLSLGRLRCYSRAPDGVMQGRHCWVYHS